MTTLRITSTAFCHNAMLHLSSVAHFNNGVDRISICVLLPGNFKVRLQMSKMINLIVHFEMLMTKLHALNECELEYVQTILIS